VSFYIFLLFLFRRKALIPTFLAFSLLVVGAFSSGDVRGKLNQVSLQLKSIVETDDNGSNSARLHLWKTGWDFSKQNVVFGTGAKASKELFVEFFYEQPVGYQEKYYLSINYPGEFHNSYMQVYVETGAIFFFLYLFSFMFPLFVMFKKVNKVQVDDKKYLVAALVVSTSFLTVQVFHGELYSYGSAVFYLVLFSGCFVLNKNKQFFSSK
jgi:O-antigen ligase